MESKGLDRTGLQPASPGRFRCRIELALEGYHLFCERLLPTPNFGLCLGLMFVSDIVVSCGSLANLHGEGPQYIKSPHATSPANATLERSSS
jgi:hypothetical protein